MIPFYIVMWSQKTCSQEGHTLLKYGPSMASKREALEVARKVCIERNTNTYVFEAVAKMELPKPEPIVTMKGD